MPFGAGMVVVWRAKTRTEHLTWASILGTRAVPPPLPAHDPAVRLADAARAQRLNWLRSAIRGANDGIVSTAGWVAGAPGAMSPRRAILTAGLVGMFAGALAMASGNVSVSSQRDAKSAMLARSNSRSPCP